MFEESVDAFAQIAALLILYIMHLLKDINTVNQLPLRPQFCDNATLPCLNL